MHSKDDGDIKQMLAMFGMASVLGHYRRFWFTVQPHLEGSLGCLLKT